MITTIKRNCEACGKEFVGTVRKRFCSDVCRVQFSRLKKRFSTGSVVSEKGVFRVPASSDLATVLSTSNFCENKVKPNEAIQKQIEAVRAEVMPDHIKSQLGKQSWKFDQKKKIELLELELKKPTD